MGVTAAIVAGVSAVGSTAYSISKDRQAARDAKRAQQTALDTRPDLTADFARASNAAAQATTQRRKQTANALGPSSTVLTSPSGVTAPPPQRKSLLGL